MAINQKRESSVVNGQPNTNTKWQKLYIVVSILIIVFDFFPVIIFGESSLIFVTAILLVLPVLSLAHYILVRHKKSEKYLRKYAVTFLIIYACLAAIFSIIFIFLAILSSGMD